MIEQQELRSVAGRDVYGPGGEKIGSVAQVYTDDQTGQADWFTVHTGLFGMNETFLPLREATVAGDRVEVPYDKATVKDAPNVSGTAIWSLRRNDGEESGRSRLLKYVVAENVTEEVPVRKEQIEADGDIADRR